MNVLERARLKFRSLGWRKDGWLWAAKYGGILVVFLIFFVPIQQRLSSYSANERSLKNEISDLKKISEGFLNPQEIAAMQERSERFMAGLTDGSRAAVLIDKISEEAVKNHMSIIQIYSDNPVPIKNERGEELELEEKKLRLLPVSFRAETDYKDLGNFFFSLHENSKEVYMVESVHIQRSTTQAETLQCDITLSYVAT
jgi:hypothetical protein